MAVFDGTIEQVNKIAHWSDIVHVCRGKRNAKLLDYLHDIQAF